MTCALLFAAALAASAPSAPAQTAATNTVPPRIVASWRQAQRELRRTDALQADGAIDSAAASRRRAAVARAFEKVCRAKGISEDVIRHWRGRLEKGEGDMK